MKNLFAIILLLSLFSCIKEDNGNDNYFLEFRPRECNYLYAIPGYMEKTVFQGNTYYDYKHYIENSAFPAEYFFLDIGAHNLDIEKLFSESDDPWSIINNNLDEPIPDLETQIELNYKKKSASLKSNLKSSTAGDNLVEMEYRTDGVEKFNISALEKLFDQEPGTSLNEYFKIIRYDPDFIASADTHNLLYGFSDKDKPEAIDEWLNLSPLAPAIMYAAFREVPNDLPDSIQFVVEIEIDRGKVLRDTSEVIHFK
ncbi:MAG: hypothetical protein ACOCW8_01755 [bacterium]